MWVENLKQKLIRAGYEENIGDFQTVQMFKGIFHCVASQSPCLPGLLFSSLPSLDPGGNILVFPHIKHFRHFLPVGHAVIDSPWF